MLAGGISRDVIQRMRIHGFMGEVCRPLGESEIVHGIARARAMDLF